MSTATTTPTVVVVTGAGGYVGTEITKQLLDRGYTVRGTVRDKQSSSVAHLAGLGKALPGKLEIIEADLLKEGSFDVAIEGATFVFHTASVANFGVGDPVEDQKNVVDPAVKGTVSVMRAAARSGVKRVVLTSSIVAMHGLPFQHLPTQTPDCWNTTSTVENGAYPTSKAQAEKAAWDLSKELDISLVTILPSMVMGPVVSKRGGFSVDTFVDMLSGGSWDTYYMFPLSVDVRDVAAAHILSAETPSANGRYILSQAKFTAFKEVADALKAEYPDLPIQDVVSKPEKIMYDTSKVEKELGLKLIPTVTTYLDQARTTVALGLLKQ